MKIAIISDIHGNTEALNAVLKDIETQKADKIFICGDLAMAGPEPVETVDVIIELTKQKDVAIILGNTDEMIIKSHEKADEYTPADETMAASLKYTQKLLRPDQIEFLKTLPIRHKEKIGQLEILLVHGSPRKISENISPDLNEQILKEMLSGTDEDIIFCGHTHLPVIYKIDKQSGRVIKENDEFSTLTDHSYQIIVNVGSVGRPFTQKPDACYAILDYFDLNSPTFNIFHKFVKYDKETTEKKLKTLPFAGSEKLAQVILNPIDRTKLFK